MNRLTISATDGSWLAGLTDGEGTFKLHTTPRGKYVQREIGFKIELRDDDTKALNLIQELLGCGTVVFHERKKPKVKAKPMATFKSCSLADLAEIIVPLFSAYPLQTKKAREFEIWKHIVLTRYHDTSSATVHRKYSEAYCLAFDSAYDQLDSIRKYEGRITM